MKNTSAYLQRLEQKGFACELSDATEIESHLNSLLVKTRELESLTLEEFDQSITAYKNEYTVYWAQLELDQAFDHAHRGKLWTQFADASIEVALQVAWRHVANKHRALHALLDKPLSGFFVLGLGKLGGNDLNFSSDIDLLAFFDPDTFLIPGSLGAAYIAHQTLQAFTKALARSGGLDFVWRVDWRLRPNASANTLAMSVSAARQYYFYQASPWHRLALLKARPVGGDISAANRFLTVLQPFVWRQNLDYRSLDELAEIKHRINLEHPSLRSERRWHEPIQGDVSGFNVKLGSGGIREIEFVVNAMQLIWGGRKPRLQVSNTMQALRVLEQSELLDKETAQLLESGYGFMRRLENALQLLDNAHTHLVPNTAAAQDELYTLLGVDDRDAFLKQLSVYRLGVNQAFNELFSSQDQEAVEALIWPENLSARSDEIVELWESGYHAYGVSVQARPQLRPLTLALSKYLGERQLSAQECEATIVRLHDYFRRLPKGEQYFRLLAQSPALLLTIIAPLRDSPAMTVLLEQSPHIIDRYLERVWRYPDELPNPDEVLDQLSYDAQLDGLRRFVNEHLYQIYWQFLQNQISVADFQAGLAMLAERSLQCAVHLVCDELGVSESPVSIIALGKLGLGAMAPMSDLDLVFVFDQEQVSLDEANHFVSRLQTAISTRMREGVVYELDTRLRPSGRSGAPTVSVASLVNHHLERAHTWEHIAFMFARPILASARIEAAVNQLKRTLLIRRRDQRQLCNDVEAMWQRITEHRVGATDDTVYNSKLQPGGLMQLEFYCAAHLLLDSSAQPTETDFTKLIMQRVDKTLSTMALEAMQHWRTLQIYERLLGLEGQPLESTPEPYLSALLLQSGVANVDELRQKNNAFAQFAMNSLRQPIGRHADVLLGAKALSEPKSNSQPNSQANSQPNSQRKADQEKWVESAVNWLN